MQKILAQIGQFLEAHAEKIVLAISGVVSLYLLFTRVVISPNRVEYGNQWSSVSQLDHRIADKAKIVESALDKPPKDQDLYVSRLDGPIEANDPVAVGLKGAMDGGFLGLLSNPLGWLDTKDLPVAVPKYAMATPRGSQVLVPADGVSLPEVGRVEQAIVQHIRAAAYVPIRPVDEANPYQESDCDINDMDLITVEGRMDLAGLRERFRRAFMVPGGRGAPDLVFAAVHLQRQRDLGDGQWGPWEDVPRTRVEPRRAMLEQILHHPVGGYEVRRIQLGNPLVIQDLLQPPAYQVACEYEQWWPPSLHGDFIDRLTKMKRDEQREAREQEKTTRDGGRPDLRRTGLPMQPPGGVEPYRVPGNRGGRVLPGQVPPGTTGRGARMPPRQDQPLGPGGRPLPGGPYQDPVMPGVLGSDQYGLGEIYQRFFEIRVTPATDWNKLKSLVFWHHDDTAQPDMRYRYRIRLAILNPLAGRGDEVGPERARLLLWSEWSEPTEPIWIPARQYLFPKQWVENTNELQVEVCKFFLGYWRRYEFKVSPGETIGRVVDVKADQRKKRTATTAGGVGLAPTQIQDNPLDPDEIDFSTGALFVAVSKVDGIGGSGQPYYQMVYKDGEQIKRLPIGSGNWPKELSFVYAHVTKRIPIEQPRPWTQSSTMIGAGPGYDYMIPGGYPGRDGGG